jgi:hypothetical protein
MGKLLFLDFDGVLHPTSAKPDKWFCRAGLLADTIASSRCEIIISSSWRFSYHIDELRALLPSGVAQRVAAVTGDAAIGPFAREREIRLYANAARVNDWMALDDCSWEFADSSRLIACNPNVGLDSRSCESLKDWLVR